MVITTDFNIFADKYHNRQHLPNDIINMIMNINTEEIKAKKETKQKFKNVIDVIKDMEIFIYEVSRDDVEDDESIDWMLDIRKDDPMDNFIDYKNKK